MTIPNEANATPDEELKNFAKEAGLDLEEPAKPEAEEKSEVKGEEPKAEPEKEEAKKEESQVADDPLDEEEKEEEKSEEKPTRIPKVVPVWKLKMEEKRASQREQELLAEIETLKNKPSDTPKQQENIDEDIKDLAEEFGIDEKLIKKIISLRSNQGLPKELVEKLEAKLKSVEVLETSLLNQKEKQEFDNDFKSVLPLIKSEYGNISDSDLAKIKTRLEKAAYLKEYANTPLAVLYKGLDNFRPIKGKKSVESSDGGKGRNEGEIDLENISPEQLEKWSDSDDKADKDLLERYFAYQDRKNKR